MSMWCEWDLRCIYTIFTSVHVWIIGQSYVWIAHSLLLHDFFHELLLFLFFSCWESLALTFLFIEHFAQMTLRLVVKLVEFFAVVDFLCVDLFVTQNNTFPDGLSVLFEVKVQELRVLNRPEAILGLHFLAKFSVNYWLFLAFDLNLQMLRLYVNDELF